MRRGSDRRAALAGVLAIAAVGCLPLMARVPGAASGQWLDAALTDEAGARRYRLYVPSAWDGKRRLPLVVMLHGCTQNPGDFATGTRMNAAAETAAAIVAYPEQPASANPRTCWTWFDAAHQSRGAGEPELIAAITRKVIAEQHVDTRRVYVAGLSAGGAMAAILGVTYPDIYAAVGIHSGVPYAAARSVANALGAMQGKPAGPLVFPFAAGAARPALIVVHGDKDGVVSPANAALIARQWNAAESAARSESGMTAGYRWQRRRSDDGLLESWTVGELGHAWSGGDPAGTFADASGPPASEIILRFFLQHSLSDSSR